MKEKKSPKKDLEKDKNIVSMKVFYCTTFLQQKYLCINGKLVCILDSKSSFIEKLLKFSTALKLPLEMKVYESVF